MTDQADQCKSFILLMYVGTYTSFSYVIDQYQYFLSYVLIELFTPAVLFPSPLVQC